MNTPQSTPTAASRVPGRRHPDTGRDSAATIAAAIAHEYRNLLMVVRSCGEILRQEIGSDDPRHRHVLELLTATNHAVALVEQLQTFAPGFVQHRELLRPSRVIGAIADRLRRFIPEDVDLRLQLKGTGIIRCDPLQLQSMCLMMLSIAVEDVGPGGYILIATSDEEIARPTRRSVSSRPATAASSAHVLITVRQGRGGITPLRKQAHTHTQSLFDQVKEQARSNGGRLQRRVEKGTGTVLRLAFPVQQPSEPLTLQPGSPVAEHRKESHIILVVEDDDSVRWSIRESLELFGYTVFEARNGAEALRLLDLLSEPPDMLLTDVVMPELGGTDLLLTLRGEGRIRSVLLMSGYEEDAIKRRAPFVADFPIIKKPFTPPQLVARIREQLHLA